MWGGGVGDLRDLSCLLRCSLLLKARLQNWHLYFFSGAEADDLRLLVGEAEPAAGRSVVDDEAAGIAEVGADGIGFKEKSGGEVKMLNASGYVQTTGANRRVGIKS
jgi:hypothetical protein